MEDPRQRGRCAGSHAPDCEVVLHVVGATRRPLVGKRMGAVLAGFAPVPVQKRGYPTEKPVSLRRLLIDRSCPAGGLVLDPFEGNGSILVAAKQLGRRAVGVAFEDRYCEAATRRLEQALREEQPQVA